MKEVVAPVAEGMDLDTLDDLPITKTTIDDGRLRTYVHALLEERGFHGNDVRIDLGLTLKGKTTVNAVPFTLSVSTRAGVTMLLGDHLIAPPEGGEPQGIVCQAFKDVRQRLAVMLHDIEKINPRTVMDLLRGGTVCTLPGNCRIFEDDEAYYYACEHAQTTSGGEMQTLTFENCYQLYCRQNNATTAISEDMQRMAASELANLERVLAEHSNDAVYLYQPSDVVDGITICYLPKHVTDLPLTREEVSIQDVEPFDPTEYAHSGLELSDFDREANTAFEETLAEYFRDDPETRIGISTHLSEAMLTPFPYEFFRMPQLSTSKIALRQLAFDVHNDYVRRAKRELWRDLKRDALLIVWIHGNTLYCFAVPASEADSIPCY